jgi:phenylpropionate dioxygenase-like ring-hydroxylating dioxygenase large terminal subunit
MNPKNSSHRYTADYPELGTGPVPVDPYVSAEYFEKERERIFRRMWLHVGRVEEIPNPGDYIVRSLEFAPASVLIIRGRDGVVRGFHNVCIHRGNKLVWNDSGQFNRVTCKYHGWTYACDGRLIGVTEQDMFFDLDKKTLGLTTINTDVWRGFIFVNLDPDPQETLSEHMADLDPLVEGFPFDSFTTCFSYQARLRANWKVLVDSQQEGYHAKTLHSRSLPGFLTNRQEPSRHVVGIRLFAKNRLISYFGNREVQPSPTALRAFQYGPSVGKFADGEAPRGINPTDDPNWAFDEYVIFPNMQILLFAGMFITHTMWPLSVNESIWDARGYLPNANTAAERFGLEFSKILLRDAWLEDGSTLEATQVGLESGAITHQILQDQELLIRHSAKVVDDIVNAA